VGTEGLLESLQLVAAEDASAPTDGDLPVEHILGRELGGHVGQEKHADLPRIQEALRFKARWKR
jgi:hypothetical protein